jgi:hypothetical protein
MIEQLKAAGCPGHDSKWEFVDAWDARTKGLDATVERLGQLFKDDKGEARLWHTGSKLASEASKQQDLGRMGCTIGHVETLLDAQARGENTICILEDDVVCGDWWALDQLLNGETNPATGLLKNPCTLASSSGEGLLFYLGWLWDKSNIEIGCCNERTYQSFESADAVANVGEGRLWGTHAYVVADVNRLLKILQR